jgi:hypothetical protein
VGLVDGIGSSPAGTPPRVAYRGMELPVEVAPVARRRWSSCNKRGTGKNPMRPGLFFHCVRPRRVYDTCDVQIAHLNLPQIFCVVTQKGSNGKKKIFRYGIFFNQIFLVPTYIAYCASKKWPAVVSSPNAFARIK